MGNLGSKKLDHDKHVPAKVLNTLINIKKNQFPKTYDEMLEIIHQFDEIDPKEKFNSIYKKMPQLKQKYARPY